MSSRRVHGAGGAPRQAQVMVSGSCMVWQGSGVSPAAGGENFWAFFFPSKHTFSPQNMLYMRVYTYTHIIYTYIYQGAGRGCRGVAAIVYKTLRKVRDPHAEERGQGPGQGGEEDKGSEQKRGGRVSDRDQLVEVGSWSSQYWECGALIGIGVDSECWGMHAGETCLIHATLLSESKEALETLKFSWFLM